MSPEFDIHPDVPLDPLAASAGGDWAIARHDAVAALPLDGRVRDLLAALGEIDALIDGIGAEALTHELIDEDEIEILDDDVVAERFVQAETQGRERMAAAETLVLSGPEVKRKIRAKQSIMPSYIAQNLYEDVRALFEIGDREGALISLERLIVLAPLAPQVEAFLEHNESRLLEYYEQAFGPWSRVVRMAEENRMPGGFTTLAKVVAVTSHVDGQRPLSDIISLSGLRTIEACAVLSQLVRSACLDLGT